MLHEYIGLHILSCRSTCIGLHVRAKPCEEIKCIIYMYNIYQEKALRIESPPSGKHPWTTATLESHSFAITRPPYVSLLFDLILPRCPFKAAYFSCG